jgi:dihydrofolate reductase
MGRLVVFNLVSADGFFVDAEGDMSWAHNQASDPEWDGFVKGNARDGSTLVFGRKTWEMMAAWWPTPEARRSDPVVAERMNAMKKVVFSRTLRKADWSNTVLVKTDPAAEVRRLKAAGEDMAVMGSGSIVSLLARDGLIDELQLVVVPLVVGSGRTLFERLGRRLALRLTGARAFMNGNVLLTYEPSGGKA